MFAFFLILIKDQFWKPRASRWADDREFTVYCLLMTKNPLFKAGQPSCNHIELDKLVVCLLYITLKRR